MAEELNFIHKIDDFIAAEREELGKFKKRGGKIAGLFCRFFPVSLVEGLDVWPIRILSGATGDAEDASEKVIRPDACPYCKTILGNFLLKKDIHKDVDLVIGLITCDQMRRTLEHLSTDLNKPVYPVQLPATKTDQSLGYYIQGIQNVMENLALSLKRKVDFNLVRMQESNRIKIAGILSKIIYNARTSPLIIHKLLHVFSWARPESFLDFLRKNYRKLPSYLPRYNIIATGSVVCEEDVFFIQALEKHSAGYIPVSCTGLNQLEGLEEIDSVPDDEVISTLARIYFNSPSCIRSRPNNTVYDRLREIISATKSRGVILKTLTFCDLWYTEKERMRQALPVPVLVLDSGFGTGEKEREITRVDSFLESLA